MYLRIGTCALPDVATKTGETNHIGTGVGQMTTLSQETPAPTARPTIATAVTPDTEEVRLATTMTGQRVPRSRSA